MRVLFTSWAWPTHYYPMVPLGWAFRAAGHEVRVAGSPSLSDAITRSGLPAVAIGEDVDFTALYQRHLGGLPGRQAEESTDWAEMRRRKGMAAVMMFVELAERMAEGLVTFAGKWRPDLVVYEPTTYAGPLAAATLGVPAVRHLWAPDFTYRGHELELTALAPLAERYGVPEVDTLGTLTVDPCPPSMQVPAELRRRTVRYVPYNGPGVMPHWLLEPRGSRPRVCVTWGTSLPGVGGSMFMPAQVIQALSGLDVEVVVAISASHREALGEVPEGTRIVESLPLHMLLPTCDAMVHQGGGGTMMTGLHSALPQLTVPQLPDQTFFCEQLASTGAGLVITREEANPESIRAGLRALLDEPSYRAAAERLHAEIQAQPTPAEMATTLERLAAGPMPAVDAL